MHTESRTRLDKALVGRTLAASRARAQMLILEGKVSVNGKVITDVAHQVGPEDTLVLLAEDFPWVSRGGIKLDHALNFWHVDVEGKIALDIGASTGGFTDVLLAHGVKKVYALDVGHEQLNPKLKGDPRVVNMEGTHIADVSPADFAEPIDLIVVDVAFISVTKVLPRVKELLAQGGTAIVLIKPQFEVGKADIGEGVVKDAALHERVLREVEAHAHALGFAAEEPIASPITGGDGNKEFLALYRHAY